MTPSDNKQVLQTVFAALAQGDIGSFIGALADDLVWHFMGSTKWSRAYRGKQAVIEELLTPIALQFERPPALEMLRLTADEDRVVVELQGLGGLTRAGARYDNRYCWICRMHEGRIAELFEYGDTALVERVL